MLLADKNAVIYGAGGAIGSAVARAFAREGARVFLTGRTRPKLDALAREICGLGGIAAAAHVDALDEDAVERYADFVAKQAGGIDISFNAIGVTHIQGLPLAELSLDDFRYPLNTYATAQFVTARAAARHMWKQRSGVILTLSATAARLPGPGALGFGVACAAVEALSRHLAGELGPRGIRVICLRSDAIPEAITNGSHSRDVFRLHAQHAGVWPEELLAQLERGTLLGRLPTLAEVANVAVFMASDYAGAMTGTVANVSCGSLVD